MQASNAVRAGKAERLSSIASAYFFLALEHRKNGKFEHFLGRSEKLHSLAIKEEPNSPVHRNNRALVREAKGDFEAAFLDFRAAKRLCNGDASQAKVVEQNSLKTRKRISPERQGLLAESIQIR